MHKDKMDSLEENIEGVSESTADAYYGARSVLVAEVNQSIAALPQASELIGGNPLKIAFENHRNHADFMANVLKINDYRILADTLPWVYHAYGSHGFSENYFPEVINAFRSAVQRNLTSEAAKEVDGVYLWMLKRHEEISKQAAHHKWIESDSPENWRDTRDLFLQTLLERDKSKALNMGKKYFLNPNELADFYRFAVEPSLYEIGSKWERGEITVADEHAASGIVTRLISGRPLIINYENAITGHAVVTAVSGEHHQIGAWMVADCLENAGWDVSYLGADTPPEDIVRHLGANKSQVLAISITMPFNLENARELISKIRADLGKAAPKIMAGGLPLRKWPGLITRLNADGTAQDCREAADLANQWLQR